MADLLQAPEHRSGGSDDHQARPVHPGELLLGEFLESMGLSQYRLAKDISVPPRRISEIVHGEHAVTADIALRLARYSGTTARFWLNLQTQHDLDLETDRLGDVPDDVRDELAARARLSGRSLQEYLRSELVGLASRPDREVLIRQARERTTRTGSRLSAEQILAHRDHGRR